MRVLKADVPCVVLKNIQKHAENKETKADSPEVWSAINRHFSDN